MSNLERSRLHVLATGYATAAAAPQTNAFAYYNVNHPQTLSLSPTCTGYAIATALDDTCSVRASVLRGRSNVSSSLSVSWPWLTSMAALDKRRF